MGEVTPPPPPPPPAEDKENFFTPSEGDDSEPGEEGRGGGRGEGSPEREWSGKMPLKTTPHED